MHPFREGDVFATFGNIEKKIEHEIRTLPNDYVIKASMAELEKFFLDKGIISPLILHTPDQYIENTAKTLVDVSGDFNRGLFDGERAYVPGTQITLAIPFEGDDWLWKVSASTISVSGYPEITVHRDKITVNYSFPDDHPDQAGLKERIHRDLESLENAVSYLRQDVDRHNAKMVTCVKSALEQKKQTALNAVNAVSSLGIPMKKNAAPATYTVPTARRKIQTSLPRVSAEPYSPEPTLDITEYDHILKVIRSMALVIERSPQSFATLDEEAIRTHFLIQLNGHYEGTATGETFNSVGKTDVLIRVGNRNIFIAECKFWTGPKGFEKAIEQLLSYLSWRDSKCALLIFNKNKDSSAVREKMHETMLTHPEFKKTISYEASGDARYVFIKNSDPGREIIITTMLFDIPVGLSST